jgi:threonyl-tRNA synthetase
VVVIFLIQESSYMKVMSVAGATGEETKKTIDSCLWNIIPKQKDLTEYLALLEEAKRRDQEIG